MTILITTILLHIPVTILGLYAVLALQGSDPPASRILGYGTFGGIALTLFRSLPGPFGLHVPLMVVLLILMVRRLSKGRWSVAVFGALLTNLLVAIGEGLIAVPIMAAMGVSLAEALSNPWLTLAGGWMSNVLLILLCSYLYLRSRRRKSGANRI